MRFTEITVCGVCMCLFLPNTGQTDNKIKLNNFAISTQNPLYKIQNTSIYHTMDLGTRIFSKEL